MQDQKNVTNSKAPTFIEELCEKLHCSEIADDLERVNYAREMLAKLQENEILNSFNPKEETRPSFNYSYELRNSTKNVSNLLEKTKQRLSLGNQQSSSVSVSNNEVTSSISLLEATEEAIAEEEFDYEYEEVKSVHCEDLSDDNWLGFFRGYEILDEHQEYVLSEHKQCILLTMNIETSKLENYLRSGIRCFMIDLFAGTELENQRIIFNLRETELKISREGGFPVITTLLAMLSPRLQYTGLMDKESLLEVSDELILTTKRKFSAHSTCNRVYVNARYLIEDCRECDFILIGPDIQVAITQIMEDELKCKVMAKGVLKSRLPVRFPGRCSRGKLSLEELEDITFAREVGLKIIVSHIAGTQKYFNELTEVLRLLNCENLHLFARLVLNDFTDQMEDSEWIAESYDGFLIDIKAEQHTDLCGESQIVLPDLLKPSAGADNFLNKVYNMQKPLLLNPLAIAEHQLCVQPYNIPHIFFYPDKFIFSSANFNKTFYFYLLQNALSHEVPHMELTQQPYYDQSKSGADSLARACVAASFESHAKAIVVCSSTPDMTIKLAHFRPQVPIIQVSATKSIGDYISVYHNVTFLSFHTQDHYSYREFITKSFVFGLVYMKSRLKLRETENVLLVYGTENDSTFCDKYLIFKFYEEKFVSHLEKVLFN